jgi:uncharacterized membrane protein
MTKTRLLWLLLIVQICFTGLSIVGVLGGGWTNRLVTYAPVLLLALHACWTLTVRRGLGLVLLAGLVGFVAEAISLHWGTLFGGQYAYPAQAGLFGVPWPIITYWSVFIYTGYWLNTSFLYWLGKSKPVNRRSGWPWLALLILADGLAVTAIDLVMDPVSVREGSWMWRDGGPYFGVPLGNFVGWFCVTAIVSASFRLFEYLRPMPAPSIGRSAPLLPVLGYMLIGLDFLAGSISFDLFPVALLCALLLIMPACLNLLLYWRHAIATNRPEYHRS